MSDFQEQLKECLQDTPAACEATCPFSLDIRSFVSKIKRGAFGPAYRAYADAVAFPNIVNKLCNEPCRIKCRLKDYQEDPIHLKALERATVLYASNINPRCYNLPAKGKRVIIIGAGPSGLACALRLANKKYEVEVYEADSCIGGRLRALLTQQEIEEEIARQFRFEQVTWYLRTVVKDISKLKADAFFVATGKSGEKFDIIRQEGLLYGSRTIGVFLDGYDRDLNAVEAIADGINASQTIEYYLQTGFLKEYGKRVFRKGSREDQKSDIEELGREQAAQEASRCCQCRCDACVQTCELMRVYQKYPSRIREEVAVTLEPVSVSRDARVATRFIASCNHCGLCKEVCPKGIDVDAFLLESHRKMREKGAMPWAYHEFWLRDMQFASEESGFFYTPKNSEKVEYVFFPGCRLSGSSPDLTERTYRFLSEQRPTGFWSDCCGAPAEWAGDTAEHQKHLAHIREIWEQYGRPKVIFACMTCMKQFSAHLPEIEGISLYEYLDATNVHPGDCVTLKQGSVFDPCASRAMPLTQKAVRSLANRIGISLVPLPNEGSNAQCCGWGGQIEIANPGLANRIAEKRIAQSDEPYIVYCANCRDIFKRRGKQAYHILELLFAGGKKQLETVPTWTESRENRKKLKRVFMGQKEGNKQMKEKQIYLIISSELLNQMDKNYILREDVETVIAHSEKSSCKLYDPDRDCYIGHAMIGNMTLWAEYRVVDGQYELLATYAHRMKILEE